MTKQEELTSLASYRESLPKDSYLRPWLEEVFIEVQNCILSDFSIHTRTLRELQAEIDKRCNAAEQYCDSAIKRGDQYLIDAINKANDDVQSIKDRARHACAMSMHELEK